MWTCFMQPVTLSGALSLPFSEFCTCLVMPVIIIALSNRDDIAE